MMLSTAKKHRVRVMRLLVVVLALLACMSYDCSKKDSSVSFVGIFANAEDVEPESEPADGTAAPSTLVEADDADEEALSMGKCFKLVRTTCSCRSRRKIRRCVRRIARNRCELGSEDRRRLMTRFARRCLRWGYGDVL